MEDTPFTASSLPDGWVNDMLTLAQDGAGPAQIMDKLHITDAQRAALMVNSPDFAEAWERCKIKSLKWWESLGQDLASGNIKGNYQIYLAVMNNNFGWGGGGYLPVQDSVKPASERDLDARGLTKQLLSILEEKGV